MKTSRIVSWGLTLAFVPLLALASSQSGDTGTGTDSTPSQPMKTPGQNMEGMPRQGGASGTQDQSGSMERDRRQQMQQSHEGASSPAIGTHDPQQQDGVGSMNEHNTTKTGQGTAEIPDQRTQDDTAP